MYPDDDETKKIANSIRLSGKTIHEWKEDSKIFLHDKLVAEKDNFRLNEVFGKEVFNLQSDKDDLTADNANLTADNARLIAEKNKLTTKATKYKDSQ